MADCSAVGTTVDRAARVVLGGTQNGAAAANHVSNLLGHASITPHSNAMPLMAPTSLNALLPNHPVSQQQQHVQMGLSHPVPVVGPPQMHPNMSMMSPQQQHQHHGQHQQMMHTMMMQHQQQQHQQQQMMMNHQRIEMMISQQQQQQQMMTPSAAQQSRTKQPTHQQSTTPHQSDNWHDGLDHPDILNNVPEEDLVAGHEGITAGASIEALAAAWAEAEAEYDQVAEANEDYANLWAGATNNDGVLESQPRTYQFINTDDPSTAADVPNTNTNWMEKGTQHFQEGEIKQAIQAFEMELQRNNPDNATAWRMLGRCHAESDMDPQAIACLENAVDRDPFCPESLLSLGVSYVNELNYERALENMKAWCTHNPKYAGMELPPDMFAAGDAAAKEAQPAFDEVKRLLESALAFDSTESADVHEALGVVYNVIKDYEAAAESFRTAIQSRPSDYQLWNKLGATLANGSQSDQALPAYHEALRLKPKYARAWLNMAISHSNLQEHSEAARCYLQTLSLNPSAKHCWTYLRMALSSEEKWDLLQLVFDQDLTAFQEHFDFVLYEE